MPGLICAFAVLTRPGLLAFILTGFPNRHSFLFCSLVGYPRARVVQRERKIVWFDAMLACVLACLSLRPGRAFLRPLHSMLPCHFSLLLFLSFFLLPKYFTSHPQRSSSRPGRCLRDGYLYQSLVDSASSSGFGRDK